MTRHLSWVCKHIPRRKMTSVWEWTARLNLKTEQQKKNLLFLYIVWKFEVISTRSAQMIGQRNYVKFPGTPCTLETSESSFLSSPQRWAIFSLGIKNVPTMHSHFYRWTYFDLLWTFPYTRPAVHSFTSYCVTCSSLTRSLSEKSIHEWINSTLNYTVHIFTSWEQDNVNLKLTWQVSWLFFVL